MIIGEISKQLPFTTKYTKEFAVFPTELPDGRQVWLEHYYNVEYWCPRWFESNILEWPLRQILLDEPCGGNWVVYERALTLSDVHCDIVYEHLTSTVVSVLAALGDGQCGKL